MLGCLAIETQKVANGHHPMFFEVYSGIIRLLSGVLIGFQVQPRNRYLNPESLPQPRNRYLNPESLPQPRNHYLNPAIATLNPAIATST